MENSATANIYLSVNAKREIITQRILAADFGRDKYTIGGKSSFVADESGLLTHIDAPTVTSFGNGKLTTRGRSKVWYCCACGDGGMSVIDYGDCCPSCGHQKCGCCNEQKVHTHSM